MADKMRHRFDAVGIAIAPVDSATFVERNVEDWRILYAELERCEEESVADDANSKAKSADQLVIELASWASSWAAAFNATNGAPHLSGWTASVFEDITVILTLDNMTVHVKQDGDNVSVFFSVTYSDGWEWEYDKTAQWSVIAAEIIPFIEQQQALAEERWCSLNSLFDTWQRSGSHNRWKLERTDTMDADYAKGELLYDGECFGWLLHNSDELELALLDGYGDPLRGDDIWEACVDHENGLVRPVNSSDLRDKWNSDYANQAPGWAVLLSPIGVTDVNVFVKVGTTVASVLKNRRALKNEGMNITRDKKGYVFNEQSGDLEETFKRLVEFATEFDAKTRKVKRTRKKAVKEVPTSVGGSNATDNGKPMVGEREDDTAAVGFAMASVEVQDETMEDIGDLACLA